jgi:hypothetical protein
LDALGHHTFVADEKGRKGKRGKKGALSELLAGTQDIIHVGRPLS